jgi:hypothetical protein
MYWQPFHATQGWISLLAYYENAHRYSVNNFEYFISGRVLAIGLGNPPAVCAMSGKTGRSGSRGG